MGREKIGTYSAKKKKILKAQLDFWLFVLPAVILVAFTMLIPFAMNIIYSLYEWNGISQNMKFVGLDNFIQIFTNDPEYWNSLFFSVKFGVFYVTIVNILALLFALPLSRRSKSSTLARLLFFLPFVISMVAIGLIWKLIFTTGFESFYHTTSFDFFQWSWLGSPLLAFYAIVIVSIWQNIGFYMVIYIAGLTSLPADVLEASILDGTTAFTRFIYIKLPLIMPSITICLFTSTLYALKIFDVILVLTRGGPANVTSSIACNIYGESFSRYNYGLATAKSLIFFIICVFVAYFQFKFTKEKEVSM